MQKALESNFATCKYDVMERTTCTLIYSLRKTRIDKEGKAPIYVRLTVNGRRAEVCARARILPRYWNQSRGQAVGNNREGREINRLPEAISFNIAQTRRMPAAVGKQKIMGDWYSCSRKNA